jgi:hypothetical protein
MFTQGLAIFYLATILRPDHVCGVQTGIKELAMVEATKSGIRLHELVRMKHESPWISLQKDFELKLDIAVVIERDDLYRCHGC